MAPAAVAVPQFAQLNKPTAHLRESSEWNDDDNVAMTDTALDFDLLAEYLLEDMGAGGFDFGASPEVIGPPAIDSLKAPQPAPGASIVTDPGVVVTPNHNPDQPPAAGAAAPVATFADPLADAAPAGAPPAATAPLPAGGDLAGELSQVQHMIAATLQPPPQPMATAHGSVVLPAQPMAPAPAQMVPMQAQMAQPMAAQPMAAQPVAAHPVPVMGMRHPSPQRQPTQPTAQPVPMAAAPITRAPPPKPTVVATHPPPKRPRVAAPPSVPKAKPSYSFAASVASVNGAAPHLRPSAPGAGAPLPLSPAGARGTAGAHKSQAQIDRRRERNRILARRTRLRKKFFFESLQKDVADLQRENAALKSIVRSRLRPDDARAVLGRCDANERLPSAIQAEGGDGVPEALVGAGPAGPGAKCLDREDFSLIRSIQNSQQCFVITDPSLHDNPIVYASNDFLTLTGYSQEEVLGRNCRFLQGTETCPEKVAKVRDAVRVGEDVNVTMANYRSDGTPFWNSLFVAALRDAENNIVNFIGVIVKVSGPEPGDSEYGKVLK